MRPHTCEPSPLTYLISKIMPVRMVCVCVSLGSGGSQGHISPKTKAWLKEQKDAVGGKTEL